MLSLWGKGHIRRFFKLFKKGQNVKNNQKKEMENNTTTTASESKEIVVLSFKDECNHATDDDVE